MLKNGDVVVVKCVDIRFKALEKYNKRRGVVSKIVCSEGRPIAAYVTFKKLKSTKMVLIPIRFLEGISTIDHIRTLNILKHTVL